MKLTGRTRKPWASQTGTWDACKILNDDVQAGKHSLSVISFSLDFAEKHAYHRLAAAGENR